MCERENKWQQNDLASTYSGIGDYPVSKQVVFHSALHYLGDLRGKTLLDVASGEGQLCRLAVLNGASRVVGVDVSQVLMENARRCGGNIEYRYGDAFNLGVIDQFDLVSAIRLLHYAETSSDLKMLCTGFYNNLKEGGRFVAVGFGCFAEPSWGDKIAHLGFSKVQQLPPVSEAKRVELLGAPNANGEPAFRFVLHYFEPNVYEEPFKGAGFSKFSFQPLLIDKSVAQPEGYWDIIEENPHLICCVAEK